jgi:hypothetical protein
MKNLTIAQASYIAGFIDGDGTISITQQGDRSKSSYSITFRVGNTNKNVLKWLKKTTGLGKITKMYTSNNWDRPNIKQMYNWTVYPTEIRVLLPQVLPYLIVKKERGEIMNEWLQKSSYFIGARARNKEWRDWKKEKCSIMKKLNKRGL